MVKDQLVDLSALAWLVSSLLRHPFIPQRRDHFLGVVLSGPHFSKSWSHVTLQYITTCDKLKISVCKREKGMLFYIASVQRKLALTRIIIIYNCIIIMAYIKTKFFSSHLNIFRWLDEDYYLLLFCFVSCRIYLFIILFCLKETSKRLLMMMMAMMMFDNDDTWNNLFLPKAYFILVYQCKCKLYRRGRAIRELLKLLLHTTVCVWTRFYLNSTGYPH